MIVRHHRFIDMLLATGAYDLGELDLAGSTFPELMAVMDKLARPQPDNPHGLSEHCEAVQAVIAALSAEFYRRRLAGENQGVMPYSWKVR